jgi:hypothetical protein
MANYEPNGWAAVGRLGLNSALGREAWRRSGWERGSAVVDEAFHHEKRSL